MANKRMFTMKIVDSDDFLDLSATAQNLYFHLNMRADDDGFVDKVERIMRDVKASKDDLNILIARNFVIPFRDEHNHGILVIKHWRMHNTLSKGRYTPTDHIAEKSQLLLKDNGAYSLTEGKPLDDSRLIEMFSKEQADNKWRTNGEQMETADKDIYIDKDLNKGSDINKAEKEENLKNLPFIKSVIEYLNDTLGTHYRSSSANTVKHINARISEGYSLEDFKTVIDKKTKEWQGTDMEKYLVPETLFGTKFEKYLNQTIIKKTSQPANNGGGYDWDNI